MGLTAGGRDSRRNVAVTLFAENINVAIRSIRTNRLRAGLTIAIIAIGITSLVGVLTAVYSLSTVLRDAYGRMGATSFSITSRYSYSSARTRIKNSRLISYDQASRFAPLYGVPAVVSVFSTIGWGETFKSGAVETNPTMGLIAADENYLSYGMYEIASGRNFSRADISRGLFNCLIGSGVARALFQKEDAVGRTVTVRGINYTVIGVVASVGNTAGGNVDRSVILPVTNALSTVVDGSVNFRIGILPDPGTDREYAYSEAERIFRSVRRLGPYDETDFSLRKSDAVIQELNESMRMLTVAAAVIGLITLLGAAVGLMNIMLVSVKERTREIGTRKALGATAARIKQQFLMEAILIGQIGGAAGIVTGICAGNVVSLAMKTPFVIPWIWILSAVAVCFAVSMLSGYFPAKKAASLDPIESLRYE